MNGETVMGKGVALQASMKYPEIKKELGERIFKSGNKVYMLSHNLISFPTKQCWWEKSDLKLIEKSAIELAYLPIPLTSTVAMPPPGCGSGGLHWKDVEPILSSILDIRFVVLLK